MRRDPSLLADANGRVGASRWRQAYNWYLQLLLPAYLLVSPFSTRSATFFLVLFVVAALPGLRPAGLLSHVRTHYRPLVALAPFLAWFMLSPIWAELPGAAMNRIVSIAALIILTLLATTSALRRQGAFRLHPLAVVGIGAAAVLLMQVLGRPDLAGELQASDFNRTALSFSLTCWVLVQALISERQRMVRALIVLVLALCVTAVAMSQSQSAQLSLIVGMAALAGHYVLRPRAAIGLLAAFCVLMLLFIGPFIALLSEAGLQSLWQSRVMVDGSAPIRLEIWQQYLAMAEQRPWAGFGPGTAPLEDVKRALAPLNGASYEAYIHFVHPHNAFLQVRYDLGVIGSFLAAFAVAGGFWAARHRLAAQPVLFVFAASCLTISSVSHGLYQSWWIAIVVLMAIYIRAIGHAEEKRNLRA